MKHTIVYGLVVAVFALLAGMTLIPMVLGETGAARILFGGILATIFAAFGASIVFFLHGVRKSRRRGQA